MSPDGLEWLQEEMEQFEDCYLLLDCPGQIELYSHVPVMRQLVNALQQWGCIIAGVYLLDAQASFRIGLAGGMVIKVRLGLRVQGEGADQSLCTILNLGQNR